MNDRVKEVTIIVKGDESTYKQKFLLYEEFKWDERDPMIKQCIDEALANSKIEPVDIKIKSLMVVK